MCFQRKTEGLTAYNRKGSVNRLSNGLSEGLSCRCPTWFWFLGPWEKQLSPPFSTELSQHWHPAFITVATLRPFRTDSHRGHAHRSLAHTKISVWDFKDTSLILHQHIIPTHQSTGLISDSSVHHCFLVLLKTVKHREVSHLAQPNCYLHDTTSLESVQAGLICPIWLAQKHAA